MGWIRESEDEIEKKEHDFLRRDITKVVIQDKKGNYLKTETKQYNELGHLESVVTVEYDPKHAKKEIKKKLKHFLLLKPKVKIIENQPKRIVIEDASGIIDEEI
ncbi:MAG: hypothetical protein KKC77_19195 [Proteobacteria bacterium]|nr:hypothetical protein [Pseudomonadota bacterium]